MPKGRLILQTLSENDSFLSFELSVDSIRYSVDSFALPWGFCGYLPMRLWGISGAQRRPSQLGEFRALHLGAMRPAI